MTRLPFAPGRRLVRLMIDLRAQADAPSPTAQAAPADPPAPRVPRAVRPAGPTALAAAHPGGGQARRQALALYTRCLRHYRDTVQASLLPAVNEDDAALAAAYFTLANLAVVDASAADAARLPAVERQFRRWLTGSGAWERCNLPDRQSFVEQLAALAVLVNESRLAAAIQGEPAQTRLRQAARAYLSQLLGLDADALSVGEDGLRLVPVGSRATVVA